MSGECWYKFFPSEWLELSRALPDDEARSLMDRTAFALLRQEHGRTSLADLMLGRWEERSKTQRDNALARWGKGRRREATGGLPSPQDATVCHGMPFDATATLDKEREKEKERIEKEGESLSRAGAKEAGAPPAPPALAMGNNNAIVPAELAEAMKSAPLTPEEALGYATHCGMTRAQVLAWALWNAERDWSRDSGGTLHKLTNDAAKASMRRWKARQPEIDEQRKARTARGGSGGDGTVRGVRIAGMGGGLADKVDF